MLKGASFDHSLLLVDLVVQSTNVIRGPSKVERGSAKLKGTSLAHS